MLKGVFKIKKLNYKPKQEWHMSYVVFGKGLLP
jgi:hypothetical protein